MARLRADARRIAQRFGLEYEAVEAEGARVKRRYGSCHKDGRIKIRLTHARTGRPLKYSSMIDTLCHELAHLKHFNHSPRFRALYYKILDWARRERIYRPRTRKPGEGQREGQVTLFERTRGKATLSELQKARTAPAGSLIGPGSGLAAGLGLGTAITNRRRQPGRKAKGKKPQPEQLALFEQPDPISIG